jgi:hypothetical protein
MGSAEGRSPGACPELAEGLGVPTSLDTNSFPLPGRKGVRGMVVRLRRIQRPATDGARTRRGRGSPKMHPI